LKNEQAGNRVKAKKYLSQESDVQTKSARMKIQTGAAERTEEIEFPGQFQVRVLHHERSFVHADTCNIHIDMKPV